MDFDDSPEEAVYRAEVRAWLKENATERDPGQLNTAHSFFDFDDVFVKEGRAWQRRLFDGGWAGITWPKEFGGRGGSVVENLIFRQEESRFDVPFGLFAVGIGMAGPTIIAHGTDEQRSRYLRAMLKGEEIWCQLFSEPGAGSDLASLATRAELDGDEWVVNGQKVWSSGAHHSDWGILLARTDLDQPKHRGITFFLMDMGTPGVEVRPLRQMTGGATFNEVFFSDVRIPAGNVVGPVNGGWGVTMTTLANERTITGSGGLDNFTQLLGLARRFGGTSDPRFRQRLADCYSRLEILRFLGFRIQTALSQGRTAPVSSVIKLFYAQLTNDLTRLTIDLQGPAGILSGEAGTAAAHWQQHFLNAPSVRIAAGSDEVQRNVIGERVLGLPGEPRTDKDVAFRDLVR